jgi:hypothetical protein
MTPDYLNALADVYAYLLTKKMQKEAVSDTAPLPAEETHHVSAHAEVTTLPNAVGKKGNDYGHS